MGLKFPPTPTPGSDLRLYHCPDEEKRPGGGEELLEGITQQVRVELGPEFSPVLVWPPLTWQEGACVLHLPGEGMGGSGVTGG